MNTPPFTVLIPARMASTRLPDKPLADIAGVPMVVRVAQQAARSGAAQVVIAADDARIVQACQAHGVQAQLTRADHASGSDRLAEACALLALAPDAIVVNVQGDEPLIDPQLINAVARLLAAQPDAAMGTAAHPIASAEDFANANVVKVVCDARGMAHYFSRAPIPHARDAATGSAWWQTATAARIAPLRHIGIYSYRAGFLRDFSALAPAPTEQIESLEQLRALWHGFRIAVHITPDAPGAGVDTPADLARVREWFSRQPDL
ncbi:3-deoxy-manno-octulosonate cytidylyltransferase [Comamonas sp. SCN 65-56]|uniref:3-deoxy-manno-octulosonate cytidylyltransferase n=1 Tax=Comamonas sp. SCN 65-56 TaxID=1660095 RepID=UPI000A7E9F0B|nr:3-deoxy-manno-octulosonate cytidylyltransferase [Comamonas sp. SCN 65-56]